MLGTPWRTGGWVEGAWNRQTTLQTLRRVPGMKTEKQQQQQL
jgi:hypothetical protein